MTTTVTITCHCKQNSFPVLLPTPSLPKQVACCHCMTCRHTTGMPFICHLGLPEPLFASSSLIPWTLRGYNTSQFGTRHFCTTCGAHMAMSSGEETDGKAKHWVLATGLLDRVEGIYVLGEHFDVASTGDGGTTRVLDDGLVRWCVGRREGDQFVQPEELSKVKPRLNERGEEVLTASCRCQGVKLEVRRPGAIPDGPGVKEQASSDLKRWSANHCFCDDCRLTSGYPCNTFLSAGRSHLHFVSQSTLQAYDSSPEKGRKLTFCGTCGATITCGIEGNEWVDVAVGLLDVDVDGGEGVAGVEEEWLEWKDEFSLPEDARDKGLVDALKRGMERVHGLRK